MSPARTIALAVGVGALVTLLTGLVPNGAAMGVSHYGLPVAWLTRLVLAPEYFPWRIQWEGLLVDLVVWSAIAAAVVVATGRSYARAS